MRSFRHRLSFRIGIAVVLLVLTVTVVQMLTFRMVLMHYSMELRQRAIAEGIGLARIVAQHGTSDEALAQELGAVPDYSVAMYDAEGVLVRASNPDLDAPVALDAAAREGAARAAGAPFFLTPLHPGSPTDVIASVEGADGIRYVGVFDRASVSRFAEGRIVVLIGIGIGTSLLGVLVTWLIARRLRRRIQTTERVVRRMAAGDLSVRLVAEGDDEVGDLERDFNRMADQLAAHVARLEGEESRQKQLFAAFTHEINTPLTSVLGYLESLQMPEIDQDPATRARYVAIAFDQAQQLDALADDLTTLSKLSYDGVKLERSEIDLLELATREANAMRPKASTRGLSIAIEGTSLSVEVDRARLGQVLRNVLDNAIRHAREGSEIRVEVDASSKSICVRDQGEGIAAEHLERLGSPLYRPDGSRDRASGGRGLGLAIAKGLMRAHGGALRIESRLGLGTDVTITLNPL